MRFWKRSRFLTLAVPAALAALPLTAQDDKPFDRTPRDCVTVSTIRRTEIIDDQTIIFHMRGNKRAYRNFLPSRCPGLEREGRFAYDVHNSRLCDVDLITVLQQQGVGFFPGFTCRLGEFHPLSPDEIDDLKFTKKNKGLDQGDVQTESAEVPPGDNDAAAEPEASPER